MRKQRTLLGPQTYRSCMAARAQRVCRHKNARTRKPYILPSLFDGWFSHVGSLTGATEHKIQATYSCRQRGAIMAYKNDWQNTAVKTGRVAPQMLRRSHSNLQNPTVVATYGSHTDTQEGNITGNMDVAFLHLYKHLCRLHLRDHRDSIHDSTLDEVDPRGVGSLCR